MRDIDEIIIHCSATYPEMNIGVKEIRQWHLAKGWDDIGYHYVITREGVVQNGRDESVKGAHAKGHNANSIGVCLVGGLAKEGNQPCNFTRKQWDMLEWLVFTVLKSRYPAADIIGHNDISEKTCPTFDVKAWAKEHL